MKIVIICVLTWTTVLASNELKSGNTSVLAERITDGYRAQEGQFPYQVALKQLKPDGFVTWCGGVLISNTDVLTAAHCTYNKVEVTVILGVINLNSAGVRHKVTASDILIHAGWYGNENDISIIRIPYTAYSANIQAAILPPSQLVEYPFEGLNAVVSGYGRISDSEFDDTRDLYYAPSYVISNNDCRRHWRGLEPAHMCAATINHMSPCEGDSGSALVVAYTKVLIGITSFGDALCERNNATVFTRITSFLHWIRSNINAPVYSQY